MVLKHKYVVAYAVKRVANAFLVVLACYYVVAGCFGVILVGLGNTDFSILIHYHFEEAISIPKSKEWMLFSVDV